MARHGDPCVTHIRYESSGVKSIVCSTNIIGHVVHLTYGGLLKTGICEIEIYAGEYVFNM